ncbi:N-acetylmuramoyl-L-alanine amidase [Leptolyngbya ohadii]|uniref:N-acetylmuramoyl-L-alanine amidase n=1 Tax=Leptolyngbya ohadii TaxID=1962290 RepID=UPI0021F211A4|nr:N-acetylmuramoyl-L-alanine amidase [Leptolyngbya ohadii]
MSNFRRLTGVGAIVSGMAAIGIMTFADAARAEQVRAEQVRAEQPLSVVYPPDQHETTSDRIFLIGTAPAGETVTVNGQPIDRRSPAGHFAPSLPLQMGENVFTLKAGEQTLTLRVTRTDDQMPSPVGTAFAEGSLSPAENIARLPNEPICFSAVAPANATVSVTLQDRSIPLLPQPSAANLPPNSAVLTLQNQPIAANTTTTAATPYEGCTMFQSGTGMLLYGNNRITGAVPPAPSGGQDLGFPTFNLSLNGQTVTQQGSGKIELLSPDRLQVVEVTADPGAARTGPSTDYSRLTPLPQGTRAAVTARTGDWLRLDYGANNGVWIRASETQPVANAVPPQTVIRSIRSRQVGDWTEVLFPLQTPVPVSLQQDDRTFTLTLYNTTAQTDTIFIDDDPVIRRMDWQQPSPGQVQYTFHTKSDQQWGYRMRYEGTTLILSFRHPPTRTGRSLEGISIVLDPGHGGPEDLGSRGPNGYPEKDVALVISNLLRDRLEARGARVYLTREADVDLELRPRMDFIAEREPTIALSLHYNALPDNGDAENTAGVGAFWYHPQAHDLALFLHDYLVNRLDRPSYGTFWNNLALTRPTVAPTVLLELGFMINPAEFEWITDPQQQERLADALANGIQAWIDSRTSSSSSR